jgi:hypothetical protein
MYFILKKTQIKSKQILFLFFLKSPAKGWAGREAAAGRGAYKNWVYTIKKYI